MRYNKVAIVAAAATAVNAQDRPEDVSICDFYTKALLKENTAENQATLLTLVVNTVVIGNYTEPNVGIKVPGILAAGEVDGEQVNLLPYFNGEMESTNRGGDSGESVNFLDGGAADPLKENKPANDEESNQYFLLTHLYQFFGALLGCTEQGMSGFDAYSADASMFEVHKFMNLNKAETTYFTQQVGMAAASFGVADADVKAVADALNSLFNVRCGPPTEVIPGQGKQLQSICITEDCPEAENAACDQYPAQGDDGCSADMPQPSGDAECTPQPGGNSTSTAVSTSAEATAQPTGEPTGAPDSGAAITGLSLGALAAGLAAFVL